MINVPKDKLWDKVKILFNAYGQESLQLSRNYVLKEKIEYKPLGEALRYFSESWLDFLHPALISLSCEAVGGDKDKTVKIGAAIVLMAGAADIHDDIMDKSTAKESNPTILGKFGVDIAILTGDALLLKGVYLLHEACKTLPRKEQEEILDSVKNTFFEMSSGVAEENSLRSTLNISSETFLNIIRQKVATAETTARIGAILGNASEREIAVMSHFGRTYGMLLSIRDEFIDIFEVEEIKNRLANECLPLPILLALQDEYRRKLLLNLLEKEITQENVERILDLSLDCESSKELIVKMKMMIDKEIMNLSIIKTHKDMLILLLNSTIEDL